MAIIEILTEEDELSMLVAGTVAPRLMSLSDVAFYVTTDRLEQDRDELRHDLFFNGRICFAVVKTMTDIHVVYSHFNMKIVNDDDMIKLRTGNYSFDYNNPRSLIYDETIENFNGRNGP